MIFLLDAARRESVEMPNLGPAVTRASNAPSRTPDPVLIATPPELKIAVTYSKQKTATCSNRYFFGAFRATSYLYYPQLSSRLAISNRQCWRL